MVVVRGGVVLYEHNRTEWFPARSAKGNGIVTTRALRMRNRFTKMVHAEILRELQRSC